MGDEDLKQFAATHLAGCPFTNFGKCQTEHCYFFVAVRPDLKKRACLFQELYLNQLLTTVFVESGFFLSLNRPEEIPIHPLSRRVAESLVDALEKLGGLLKHQSTHKQVRDNIQKMRDEISKALNKFLEA